LGIAILIVNPYLDYSEPSIFNLLLRKVALVAIGASLAHLTWKNLMGYVHSKQLLEDQSRDLEGAVKYMGLCFFRGFYYLAWILGVATGL